MTYSPAPWRFTKTSPPAHASLRDNVREILDASDRTIFSDTTYYPWCSDNDDDWPLVAAAPELLAALRVMVGVYAELAQRVGVFDGVVQLTEARDVIAKAEGKS